MIRLATRRSPLALTQATAVLERLTALGVAATLVEVETRGDQDQQSSIASLGGIGVFAAEVQRAVLTGRADVAVHSAKDLPSVTPEGLVLACVPERRDPADVLVGRSLAGLGPGATVATGSPRRRALLAERRPDLQFVELRGNMATRVAAVGERGVDAVVAAAAALERLGWQDRVAERLDPSWCTPQVGQGAIALETRATDEATRALLAPLNDRAAAGAVSAERAFLSELGAGCSIPAAAHATWSGDRWHLTGVLAAPDGSRVVRATRDAVDPVALGVAVAREVRDTLGGGTLGGLRS
jgi:hydroxymethylbilane synthase